LASGFLLLRSFGIDRFDAPAHGAGRGSAGPGLSTKIWCHFENFFNPNDPHLDGIWIAI
jgi:hypothetical protein